MRTLLTQFGIPSDTVANAVNRINMLEPSILEQFNASFNLTPDNSDTLTYARFAAVAIVSGADTTEKVVSYVRRRMCGIAEENKKSQTFLITGSPIYSNTNVSIVPVISGSGFETGSIKGKQGRKKNGSSDFYKAVTAIESCGSKERYSMLNAIKALGVKDSSAVVYLWRYNNGERS